MVIIVRGDRPCVLLLRKQISYGDHSLVICNPYRAFHKDLFQDHALRTTSSSHNLHLYFLFETNKSLKMDPKYNKLLCTCKKVITQYFSFMIQIIFTEKDHRLST